MYICGYVNIYIYTYWMVVTEKHDWMIFPEEVGNITIIPAEGLIFFRGVGIQPTSCAFECLKFSSGREGASHGAFLGYSYSPFIHSLFNGEPATELLRVSQPSHR